jgi:hypothetical protein
VTAALTFHRLGIADCARFDLASGRRTLIDHADMPDPHDPYDRRGRAFAAARSWASFAASIPAPPTQGLTAQGHRFHVRGLSWKLRPFVPTATSWRLMLAKIEHHPLVRIADKAGA